MLTTKLGSPDVEHEETQHANSKKLYHMLEDINRYITMPMLDLMEEYYHRLRKKRKNESKVTKPEDGKPLGNTVLEEMYLFHVKGDNRYLYHNPGETGLMYPANW